MRKRRAYAIFFLILTVTCPGLYAKPDTVASNQTMAATARSYILMEQSSGQVLLERSSEEEFPPASITKIMTLLLINEAIDAGKINWDDQVTISEHAAHMGGSQVFMEPGEIQTVRDLVKCISIASANDAAVAMSEYIAGS